MKTQHIITALLALASTAGAASPPAPCGAVPSEQQIQWQRLEWYGFIHLGLTTYNSNGQYWSYGNEEPQIFNPDQFDADKIVSIFKHAGMKGMIFTAKHHDGFCLWPTESTEHNITHASWKNGQGDMVKEFARACRENDMLFGVYISPWDRNCAEYGRPGYLKVYYKQIEELLTKYGNVFEIWFDGANGGDGYYGGAREKRSIGVADEYYKFADVVNMIRKLQPNCIIWGAAGRGDAEWGGSEQGTVDYPYWNVCPQEKAADGQTKRHLPDTPTEKEKWLPFEADVSMGGTHSWFWTPDAALRTYRSEKIMDNVYMKSVGNGANLIINLAPDRSGQLEPLQVNSLLHFGNALRKLLAHDYAKNAMCTASNVRGNDPTFGPEKLVDNDIESYWCTDDGVTTGEVELQLDKPATFDVVRVREQIRLGQRVQNFAVDAWLNGQWVTIDDESAEGKSIGNQVMRRVQATTTDKVRLRITKSRACPCISELSLLKMPDISEEYTTWENIELYWLNHPIRAKTILAGIGMAIVTLAAAVIVWRRRRVKTPH